MHKNFMEFGRSGKIHNRSEILDEFQEAKGNLQINSRGYAYNKLAENVVLVTYESAHVDSNGDEGRHSLRSSTWEKTEHGWQLLFHQGTPRDEPGRMGNKLPILQN
ncbi:MAG: nuclear transport factor 2 family protein [Gammaproteobacteria bacterium]|nr:nuclear transport factor 2 family protein [Gammaproteobacteria bacterium]